MNTKWATGACVVVIMVLLKRSLGAEQLQQHSKFNRNQQHPLHGGSNSRARNFMYRPKKVSPLIPYRTHKAFQPTREQAGRRYQNEDQRVTNERDSNRKIGYGQPGNRETGKGGYGNDYAQRHPHAQGPGLRREGNTAYGASEKSNSGANYEGQKHVAYPQHGQEYKNNPTTSHGHGYHGVSQYRDREETFRQKVHNSYEEGSSHSPSAVMYNKYRYSQDKHVPRNDILKHLTNQNRPNGYNFGLLEYRLVSTGDPSFKDRMAAVQEMDRQIGKMKVGSYRGEGSLDRIQQSPYDFVPEESRKLQSLGDFHKAVRKMASAAKAASSPTRYIEYDEFSGYTHGYAPKAPIALENSFCIGRKDGNFANPGLTRAADPRCTYIICSGERAILFNCAPGTFNGRHILSNAPRWDPPALDYNAASHHRFAAYAGEFCGQRDTVSLTQGPVCTSPRRPRKIALDNPTSGGHDSEVPTDTYDEDPNVLKAAFKDGLMPNGGKRLPEGRSFHPLVTAELPHGLFGSRAPSEYSAYKHGYGQAPIALGEANRFCVNMEDGNYANPGLSLEVDPRCTYVTCASNLTYIFNCPLGTFNGLQYEHHYPQVDAAIYTHHFRYGDIGFCDTSDIGKVCRR